MTYVMHPEDRVEADRIKALVDDTIRIAMTQSARSRQAADHMLGVSDVGGCREYVRRMITQEPWTDEQVSVLPAFVGTWIGSGVETEVGKRDGVQVQVPVTVTLPNSGLTLRGTADIVEPTGVIDTKSVDGLGTVRNAGPSDQHWFQVTLYYAGLLQAGVLPEGGTVSLVYLDRSGREEGVVVFTEQYSPARLTAAEDWLEDVLYAVRHSEEASKDKPRSWCWACCPYATACRSGDTDVEGLIEDPIIQNAIDVLLEAKALKAAAEKDIKSAQSVLANVEGSTGTHTVRWVQVNGSTFTVNKAPSKRLDVKPVRRPK